MRRNAVLTPPAYILSKFMSAKKFIWSKYLLQKRKPPSPGINTAKLF